MSVSPFRRRFLEVGFGLGLGLTGLVTGTVGLGLGCQPEVPNTIMGTNGPITLTQINAILNNGNLDEAQKRQALRDLGITDEQLIDVLIRG